MVKTTVYILNYSEHVIVRGCAVFLGGLLVALAIWAPMSLDIKEYSPHLNARKKLIELSRSVQS